jgi:hypothetical protein
MTRNTKSNAQVLEELFKALEWIKSEPQVKSIAEKMDYYTRVYNVLTCTGRETHLDAIEEFVHYLEHQNTEQWSKVQVKTFKSVFHYFILEVDSLKRDNPELKSALNRCLAV